MKKNVMLNNKGFVLAETLVVAVAITLIFGLVFKNFYPLFGEYERREQYDDLDSKYGTYWIKKIIQSKDYDFSYVDGEIGSKGYAQFSCSKLNNTLNQNMCNELLRQLEVSCDTDPTDDRIDICSNTTTPHIYITKFSFMYKDAAGNDKNYKKEYFYKDSNLSEDLKTYFKFLPDYSKVVSLNKAQYRIVVEYYRHRFDTPYKDAAKTQYALDTDNDYKTFSTIEIKKD